MAQLVLDELYASYINDHRDLWSQATINSEEARVRKYTPFLTQPQPLFVATKNLGSYSRKTLFVRASQFNNWLVEKGLLDRNEFPGFMRKNFRAFQYAYVKKPLQLTWEDVTQRVTQICDTAVRDAAQEYLRSGLRFHELSRVEGGFVKGKGGKTRRTNASPGVSKVPYNRFYYELKKVGLTPHMLRKAALSRLVDMGASTLELMTIAGWSNLNTAQSYLQARQSRVNHLLEEMAR